MLFSSILFLFYFLPLFFIAYYTWRGGRNIVLLAFSVLFYGWGDRSTCFCCWPASR